MQPTVTGYFGTMFPQGYKLKKNKACQLEAIYKRSKAYTQNINYFSNNFWVQTKSVFAERQQSKNDELFEHCNCPPCRIILFTTRRRSSNFKRNNLCVKEHDVQQLLLPGNVTFTVSHATTSSEKTDQFNKQWWDDRRQHRTGQPTSVWHCKGNHNSCRRSRNKSFSCIYLHRKLLYVYNVF